MRARVSARCRSASFSARVDWSKKVRASSRVLRSASESPAGLSLAIRCRTSSCNPWIWRRRSASSAELSRGSKEGIWGVGGGSVVSGVVSVSAGGGSLCSTRRCGCGAAAGAGVSGGGASAGFGGVGSSITSAGAPSVALACVAAGGGEGTYMIRVGACRLGQPPMNNAKLQDKSGPILGFMPLQILSLHLIMGKLPSNAFLRLLATSGGAIVNRQFRA